MDRLSYKTLEAQGFNGYLLKDAPERVFQFGEGNLRATFCAPSWRTLSTR